MLKTKTLNKYPQVRKTGVDAVLSVILILIFKILPMLMECSILLMGNTMKWQGGDMNDLTLRNFY